ncbi:MAG: HutD family protein [Gammaproteobacteria bacterium]|nr:HutD family protein [Gammaproteobacteria bacterium]
MPIKIIRESEFSKMPWKNGGGSSYEIYRLPATSDYWDFRVSIAEVNSDGPFSLFPNCERFLMLLSDNGMHLKSNELNHSLLKIYDHLYFSGDLKITASLENGPNRDFNVIWNKDKFIVEISIKTGAFQENFEQMLLYAHNGEGSINGEKFTQGDAVLCKNQSASVNISGEILLIKFRAS